MNQNIASTLGRLDFWKNPLVHKFCLKQVIFHMFREICGQETSVVASSFKSIANCPRWSHTSCVHPDHLGCFLKIWITGLYTQESWWTVLGLEVLLWTKCLPVTLQLRDPENIPGAVFWLRDRPSAASWAPLYCRVLGKSPQGLYAGLYGYYLQWFVIFFKTQT